VSGFRLAAAAVASPRRKPTVVMMLQFSCTIALMLSGKSDGEFDSTSAVCTPSSSAARSMPSCEVWLNDLSLKPPESETMQALKSGYCSDGAELVALSVGVGSSPALGSSRSPQPAKINAATPRPAAATRAVFLTAPPVCVGVSHPWTLGSP
jgi:hypothetical protein